jgi:hypothetical protein
MDDSTVAQGVLMAAHEASDNAQEHETGIGPATLEQLRADVSALARAYDTGDPFTVYMDMRRVREKIYRLLDQRPWPRHLNELYFLLCCLNGMMGNRANHLGYPDAAEELIRSAWVYANAIDHNPLRGSLRQALSAVMYDRGLFEASRDLARSGLEYLSEGPVGADLHLFHAKAAARLGDAETARQAIHDAREAHDRDSYTDDLLEMGGKFRISWATHYGLAGAALTTIPRAEREAAERLEQAIVFYDEGPRRREDHWFAGKPLAAIDLAMVRLRSGALDGAADALRPAFSLPAGQRIGRVTARLAEVRAELAAPIFSRSPQAREIGTQIEEFNREAATAGLHSLAG